MAKCTLFFMTQTENAFSSLTPIHSCELREVMATKNKYTPTHRDIQTHRHQTWDMAFFFALFAANVTKDRN